MVHRNSLCENNVYVKRVITQRGSGLLSGVRVGTRVEWRGFSEVASDWLAAVLPASRVPGSSSLWAGAGFGMEVS